MIYDQIDTGEDVKFKDSLELTASQKEKVQNLRDDSQFGMRERLATDAHFCDGTSPFYEANISKYPHMHLPWLYHVLQQMEKVQHIKEQVPDKKAKKGFVHRRLKELLDLKGLPKNLYILWRLVY